MSELKLYQFQGVIMEQFCPVCKGSPETSPQKHGITKQCAGCQDYGKILTPAGDELIDFVAENFIRKYRNCFKC